MAPLTRWHAHRFKVYAVNPHIDLLAVVSMQGFVGGTSCDLASSRNQGHNAAQVRTRTSCDDLNGTVDALACS